MASSSRAKRPRRRVVWDEENLAHLEETKTPKQIINEPKTPYHTLSLDPDEANNLSPMQLPSGSDNEKGNTQVNPEQVCTALNEVASSSRGGRGRGRGGWTSSEDEGDAGEFEKWLEDRGITNAPGDEEGPSVSFQGTDDYYASTKVARSDKVFKEHRRRHYDEFRKLKVLRSDGEKEGDVDEVEGEEKGKEAANGVRSESKDAGEQGYWGGAESDGEVKKGLKVPLPKSGDNTGSHHLDESSSLEPSASESEPPADGTMDDGT